MLTLYIIITLLISAIVQTFMQLISWFAFYRLVKHWEKVRFAQSRSTTLQNRNPRCLVLRKVPVVWSSKGSQ